MQNYAMKKMKILIFITMCERFLLEPNSNMIIDHWSTNWKSQIVNSSNKTTSNLWITKYNIIFFAQKTWDLSRITVLGRISHVRPSAFLFLWKTD